MNTGLLWCINICGPQDEATKEKQPVLVGEGTYLSVALELEVTKPSADTEKTRQRNYYFINLFWGHLAV